jgi:hypothetical protein
VRASLAKIAPKADEIVFTAADLNSGNGWAEAAAVCDYVLHVASPIGSHFSRMNCQTFTLLGIARRPSGYRELNSPGACMLQALVSPNATPAA